MSDSTVNETGSVNDLPEGFFNAPVEGKVGELPPNFFIEDNIRESAYIPNTNDVVAAPRGLFNAVKREVNELGDAWTGGNKKGRAQLELNKIYFDQLNGKTSPMQQKRREYLEGVLGEDLKVDGLIDNMVRATSNQVPQMLELMARAGFGGVTGGAIGFGGGMIVTKNPAASAQAARVGAKIGGGAAATEFMFIQNAGQVYGELSQIRGENGEPLDPTAVAVSSYVGAAAMAGLEMIPVAKLVSLVPASDMLFKKMGMKATDVVKLNVDAKASPATKAKAIRDFARNIAEVTALETATEGVQEGVQIAAGEAAKYFSKGDFESIKGDEILDRIGGSMKEAALAAPLFGAGFGGTRLYSDLKKASPKAIKEEVVGPTQERIKAIKDIKPDQLAKEDKDYADFIEQGRIDPEITKREQEVIGMIQENMIIDQERKQHKEIKERAKAMHEQIQMLRPKKLPKKPETLAEFIKKRGGLKINAETVGLTKKETPELNGVASKNGLLTLEQAKELAEQNGFMRESDPELPPTLVGDDVMDALVAESYGMPSVRETDISQMANYLQAQDYNAQLDQALYEAINELGLHKYEGDITKARQKDLIDFLRKEAGLGPYIRKEKYDLPFKPITQPITFDDVPNIAPEVKERVKALSEERQGWLSNNFLTRTAETGSNMAIGLENALTPISTRVKNINFRLFKKLRRMEMNYKAAVIDGHKRVEPFLRAIRKLDADTRLALGLALYNSDRETVKQIAVAYNMQQEISELQILLDEIYDRAKDADIEVEYRFDFFPRVVDDIDGLMDHLHGDDSWSIIQEALDRKSERVDRELRPEEEISVINQLMRGRTVEGINLSERGVFKERRIETLTDELYKYYKSPEVSLLNYISMVNEAIEASKFFGKAINMDGSTNMEESVGALVKDLFKSGEISSSDMRVLTDVLNARFNEKHMSGFWAAARDLTYIDTMGSPLNAITQIGDLAISMYNSGVMRTFLEVGTSIKETGPIKLEDLGIDQISEEFGDGSWSSKLVNGVFKRTGLHKMDRIGKLTLVNSALKKYKDQIDKNDPSVMRELKQWFEEDAQQVADDISAGNITDDVKFLLFNKLLDMQPVAKSEMPQYYLTGGNWKMLYVLKSFTLRQLDIYRREVFSKLKEAHQTGDKKMAAQAIGNFIRLAGFWMAMTASADFTKDFVKSFFGGDEIEDPEDYLVDATLKSFAFSKYQVDMIGKKGPVEVAGDMFLPPAKFLTNLWRDAKSMDNMDSPSDLRVIRSIPIGGELYYFWFGGKSGNGGSSETTRQRGQQQGRQRTQTKDTRQRD